jgi:4-hydroxy-tetrahydrodipicolinate reductase
MGVEYELCRAEGPGARLEVIEQHPAPPHATSRRLDVQVLEFVARAEVAVVDSSDAAASDGQSDAALAALLEHDEHAARRHEGRGVRKDRAVAAAGEDVGPGAEVLGQESVRFGGVGGGFTQVHHRASLRRAREPRMEAMTTRVAIVGASGRLGGVVRSVIEQTDGYEVLAMLGSQSDIAEIAGADLVVDVSTPAVSIDVVRAATERGINVLVGTSGWSEERIALVRPLVAAAGTGVVFIPNFSLGSVLGSAIAAAAAPFFPSIEIIEAHHERKVDSPSGTAVRTAELIAAARADVGPVEAPHADQRARGQRVASVPVHSLRRPGVIAKQEVVLSGPGESLHIVHDTIEPARAYAPGIRIALDAARTATGMIVGLDTFIDIGIGRPGSPAGSPIDDGGVPGQVAAATGL